MTSPARVQYPRFNITGQLPGSIAPGALAMNLVDRKLYVGDLSSQPVLMSQYIRDWNIALAYATGDIVLNQLALYRAKVNITAGTPFSTAQWETIATSERAENSVPSATGIVSGGIATLTAGFTDRISVTAGSAVILDADNPLSVNIDPFSWAAFDITLVSPGVIWSVVGINKNGGISNIPYANFNHAWRDNNVLLAFVAWNGVAIYRVIDATYPVGNTATAFLDAYFDRGGAYRSTGVILAARGSGLDLKSSAGTIFSVGDSWRTSGSPNTRGVAAQNPRSFAYFQPGVPPVVVSVVNPNLWWNGTALLAVPTGNVTIQFFGLSPDNSVYASYGGTLYASIGDAIANIAADWDAARSPMVPLAAVIVPQGVTNLTTQAVIVVAAENGDPYASSADTSGFLLLDGTRPMLGALNMGGFAILNADIDGGSY